jgi:MFS family permease
MASATVIQTASQSVNMFIGARFLIGFGLGFAGLGSPLLISELSYPPYRAPLTGIYNSLWHSGAIIAAWVTFGTFKITSSWSWRTPSAFQGLAPVVQLLLVWFHPESPRWLISKGREEEALKLLAYYHADSNYEDPLVKYEFEEIKSAIELDRTVNENVSWMSLFNTPGNRRRMRVIIGIGFISQWSGNGLVSYYLNKVFDILGITNPTIQVSFTQSFAFHILTDQPSPTASHQWHPHHLEPHMGLGRRNCRRQGRSPSPLHDLHHWNVRIFHDADGVHSAIRVAREQGCCPCCHRLHFPLFPFLRVSAFGPLLVFPTSADVSAYSIALSPLLTCYTVEILPYQLRAKGLTISSLTVVSALVFNQYVNPIALLKLNWKYYIVYVVWIAVEAAFLYIFVVETKNRTLEETAVLFDGEDSTQQLAETALQHAHIAGPEDEKASVEKASISHVEQVSKV